MNKTLIWDTIPTPAASSLTLLAIANQPGLKWVKESETKVGVSIDLPSDFAFTPGKPYRKLEFNVRKLSLVTDESVFCVLCNDPPLFEIFQDLCNSLVSGLEGITDAHHRAHATILRAHAWSELFKSGRRELNRQQILGLYCELRFLVDQWLPLGYDIDTWFGPDRKSQDFLDVADNLAVEVKYVNSSNSVSISSIHQLSFGGCLYLVGYQLTESEAGASLNDLVRLIRSQLDPLQRATFDSKLIKIGYETLPSYDEQYTVTNSMIFKVNNDFPKITPGTLHGVVQVRYTLQLDTTFNEFMCEFSDIGKEIEPR